MTSFVGSFFRYQAVLAIMVLLSLGTIVVLLDSRYMIMEIVKEKAKVTKSATETRLDMLWEEQLNTSMTKTKHHHMSLPFVSSHSFRGMADAALDETTRGKTLVPAPEDLKNITKKRLLVIFVKTDFVTHFFDAYHEKVPGYYILITGGSDLSVPSGFTSHNPQGLLSLHDKLNFSKLVHWFGVNTDIIHHKLSTIPIGINNAMAGPSAEVYLAARKQAFETVTKQRLLILNFFPRTHEHSQAIELFTKMPWAECRPKNSENIWAYQTYQNNNGTLTEAELHQKWLVDMAQYKFALSPAGNGMDCYRTWEMMIMGVIPIVRSSTLDMVFADIPAVLIVDRWEDVTKELLEQHWEQYGSSILRDDLLPQLTLRYWMERIWSIEKPKD